MSLEEEGLEEGDGFNLSDMVTGSKDSEPSDNGTEEGEVPEPFQARTGYRSSENNIQSRYLVENIKSRRKSSGTYGKPNTRACKRDIRLRRHRRYLF